MQVLCPSCETGYEIPALQRPRKLRCARCASEWRVVPAADMAMAAPVALGAPEPVAPVSGEVMAETPTLPEALPDSPSTASTTASPAPPLAVPLAEQRLTAAAPPGRRAINRDDLLIASLWLASLLVIAVSLWALWHWRGPIGHRWPPSLRLYRLLPHGIGRGAR